MTVRYIAHINDTTRAIIRLKPSPIVLPEEGLVNGVLIKHLTEDDFNSRAESGGEFVANYYLNTNDEWTAYPEKPNSLCHWNRTQWSWTETAFWEQVREQRAFLLYESDWTVVPDSPLSDADKSQVMTYRQALRDITSQAVPASGDWKALTWPTKPACLG